MPTTPYTEYFQYVEPYVPGCPSQVVSAYIAEAANDFCAKTYLWRTPIDATNTVADTQDYLLTPPADTEVVDVTQFEVERVPLARVHEASVPLNVSDSPSRPLAYALIEPDSIRFYPTPDAVYSFRGLMVLKPTLTATGAETFLFFKHGRCIAAGALERLFSLPNKPWSDPVLAAEYRAYYHRSLSDARIYDRRSVNRQVRQNPFA